jgi:hypothetical protein
MHNKLMVMDSAVAIVVGRMSAFTFVLAALMLVIVIGCVAE